jgi:hypothetical protein
MIYIEIQRGKHGMRKQKYSALLGATAGCTLRLAEGSAYCGQSNPERATAKEKFKPNLFVCDAWFGSVVMAEHMKTLYQTATGEYKGHEVIAAVKKQSFSLSKGRTRREDEGLSKWFLSCSGMHHTIGSQATRNWLQVQWKEDSSLCCNEERR